MSNAHAGRYRVEHSLQAGFWHPVIYSGECEGHTTVAQAFWWIEHRYPVLCSDTVEPPPPTRVWDIVLDMEVLWPTNLTPIYCR